MRILFWVPYPKEGASNRYRVEQYLPYLEAAGIGYCVHSFWARSAYKILYENGHYFRKSAALFWGTLLRLLDILFINRYNAVFIHREAHPVGGAVLETIIFFLKKPIIFDFDDAIFLGASSSANSSLDRFKKPEKIKKILKISSQVIAGNRYLADFALNYNSSVTIIPTCIDTDKFYPMPKARQDEVIIGWMGSLTTAHYLEGLKEVFETLLNRFPNLRIKIVGGKLSLGDDRRLINKNWCFEEEIADLRSFDIGIMPISDNKWAQGKCGLKAILYMSMGIPCVCSDVGVIKEIVKDGVNGFLAKSKEEWLAKLSFLINDPQARKSMGLAGKLTVQEKYSLQVNAPIVLGIIKKVIGQA